MILPLLDYSDTVWGDKHNKMLMAKVRLLQNKAAESILDKVKHSSATEAINELYWLVLFSFEMYVASEQFCQRIRFV